MIDATLQELWSTKDAIAREYAYDLDKLVNYLKEKHQSGRDGKLQSQDHKLNNNDHPQPA